MPNKHALCALLLSTLSACSSASVAPPDGAAGTDGAVVSDAGSTDLGINPGSDGGAHSCASLGGECLVGHCCAGLTCENATGHCIETSLVKPSPPKPPSGFAACGAKDFGAGDTEAACGALSSFGTVKDCSLMSGESGRIETWCSASSVYVYVRFDTYAVATSGSPCASPSWGGWQSTCLLDGTGCTFPSFARTDGQPFALDAVLSRDPGRHGATPLRIGFTVFASCPSGTQGAPTVMTAAPDPGLVLP